MSVKGIKPNPKKLKTIQQLHLPWIKSELWNFLGVIAYIEWFITNFNTLTAPLLVLVGKDTNFDLTPTWEFNFRKLKDKLMKAPILKYPMWDCDYQIETYALDATIGGVLLIIARKRSLSVAYKSCKLTKGKWR